MKRKIANVLRVCSVFLLLCTILLGSLSVCGSSFAFAADDASLPKKTDRFSYETEQIQPTEAEKKLGIQGIFSVKIRNESKDENGFHFISEIAQRYDIRLIFDSPVPKGIQIYATEQNRLLDEFTFSTDRKAAVLCSAGKFLPYAPEEQIRTIVFLKEKEYDMKPMTEIAFIIDVKNTEIFAESDGIPAVLQ